MPYSALRSLFLLGEEILEVVRLETEPSSTRVSQGHRLAIHMKWRCQKLMTALELSRERWQYPPTQKLCMFCWDFIYLHFIQMTLIETITYTDILFPHLKKNTTLKTKQIFCSNRKQRKKTDIHIEAAHMQKPTLNAICHKQSEQCFCGRGQYRNAQVNSCWFKIYITVIITMSPRWVQHTELPAMQQ